MCDPWAWSMSSTGACSGIKPCQVVQKHTACTTRLASYFWWIRSHTWCAEQKVYNQGSPKSENCKSWGMRWSRNQRENPQCLGWDEKNRKMSRKHSWYYKHKYIRSKIRPGRLGKTNALGPRNSSERDTQCDDIKFPYLLCLQWNRSLFPPIEELIVSAFSITP